MLLADLSYTILTELPHFIDDIETFTNAASSCQIMRAAFTHTPPRVILQLAAASGPKLFQPHPHFLTLATARQTSDWVLESPQRRLPSLRKAFRGGVDSLWEFCLQHAYGLTFERIRTLSSMRFSVINVLADQIDKMAGDQWYATPDFWDGGVSEAETLYTEANLAAYQILLYGELFASTLNRFLDGLDGPYIDLQARIDYICYCIPDLACQGGYPGFEVLNVGPYKDVADLRDLPAHQVALTHILSCRRWKALWSSRLQNISDPFACDDNEHDLQAANETIGAGWKQFEFRNALMTQGLEGVPLITLSESELSSDILTLTRQLHSKIDHLPSRPKRLQIEVWTNTETIPNLLLETIVCMRGRALPSRFLRFNN